MTFVMGSNDVAQVQGGGCNQRVFTSHGAILDLQIRQQFLPSNQYRFRQLLSGRRKPSPYLGEPTTKARLVCDRRPIESKLQLGQRHDAQEYVRFIVLDPSSQFRRDLLPL